MKVKTITAEELQEFREWCPTLVEEERCQGLASIAPEPLYYAPEPIGAIQGRAARFIAYLAAKA